jgi:hypothetical protein
MASAKPLQPGPEYHYFRAPYPILSFLYGLYCDKHWSDAEYEKWEESEDPQTHVYSYEKYLDPYPNIPATARRVITTDVASVELLPPETRRKPRILDCDSIWPDLSEELTRAVKPRADGRAPEFQDARPVFSALACIYLGDFESVAHILSKQPDAAKLLPVPLLEQLFKAKGTIGARPLLEELKPRLYSEFIAPPPSW